MFAAEVKKSPRELQLYHLNLFRICIYLNQLTINHKVSCFYKSKMIKGLVFNFFAFDVQKTCFEILLHFCQFLLDFESLRIEVVCMHIYTFSFVNFRLSSEKPGQSNSPQNTSLRKLHAVALNRLLTNNTVFMEKEELQ